MRQSTKIFDEVHDRHPSMEKVQWPSYGI
jgi:hypothetical protein